MRMPTGCGAGQASMHTSTPGCCLLGLLRSVGTPSSPVGCFNGAEAVTSEGLQAGLVASSRQRQVRQVGAPPGSLPHVGGQLTLQAAGRNTPHSLSEHPGAGLLESWDPRDLPHLERPVCLRPGQSPPSLPPPSLPTPGLGPPP